MMLFNFRLSPVENIHPWGSENDLQLHWFALTDGCYWLNVGENQLFRYSDEFLLKYSDPESSCTPYVDYYVVRLWEDLLDTLPNIMSPVPMVLAEKMNATHIRDWFTKSYDRLKKNNFDVPSDAIFQEATEWIHKRKLSTDYLKSSPRIWFWRDGTSIHIEWDNQQKQIDGIKVWASELGSWSLPVDDFLNEVRRFNQELMQAMQNRVGQVITGWTRPDIHIDKKQLIINQAIRSTWLGKALSQANNQISDNWNEIIKATELIEHEMGS